jgi:hypothetical protein
MTPDMARRPFGVSRALWLLGVVWSVGLIITVAWPAFS